MQKEDKQRVVAELTERLRSAESLIVADYRGLTMPQVDGLRDELARHGARFQVVKNTLTRIAAKEAEADALLPLLEGPSAIAFVEADGDAAAAAKALAAAARETRVLEIRGGVMQARTLTAADVDELSRLPSLEVLRGQVLGAIVGPLTAILGLVNAPLQNLHGLIDARIEQLQAEGADAPATASADVEAEVAAQVEAAAAEPEAEAAAVAEAAEAASEPEGAAPVPQQSEETQETGSTEEEQ